MRRSAVLQGLSERVLADVSASLEKRASEQRMTKIAETEESLKTDLGKLLYKMAHELGAQGSADITYADLNAFINS